jgi:ribonuclease HI
MSIKFYAVVKGKNPGIYTSWKECEFQVKGFSGAIYKSFKTKNEAEEFIKNSTFTTKHDQAKTVAEDRTIIYTDGSCDMNNNLCGFGVVILSTDKKKYRHYGKVPISIYKNINDVNDVNKKQYNDVAELYAIYVALCMVSDNDVILYTDCEYALNTLTSYIHAWIKDNTFKNRPNYELLHAIYDKMKNRNIDYQHVNSHIGIQYNEECDVLAKKGRLLENDDIISTVKYL